MRPVRRIALTAGEPAGIGPDLCVQLAQQQQHAQLIAIADPELLRQRAAKLDLPLHLIEADLSSPAAINEPGSLYYLPVALKDDVVAGELNPANSHYVLQSLQVALDGSLQKNFDAIVTAPEQEHALALSKALMDGLDTKALPETRDNLFRHGHHLCTAQGII